MLRFPGWVKWTLTVSLLALITVPATADEVPCTHELIENYVAKIVVTDLYNRLGYAPPQVCIETDEMALCLAPGTSDEYREELLRSLPTWVEEGERYNTNGRWSTVASGYFPYMGDPIILTYSFVPDGTYIPSGAGEPGSPSNLYAILNAQFGSEAAWKEQFALAFADWASHIGITYILEPDDGSTFPGSVGVLGVRGDVRISGHNIDGSSNILAYNRFPSSGGDMVLDTSENWANDYLDYRFIHNVVTHEHGHGIGLLHVEPINQTKLMEANYTNNVNGPRDDDIRGGSRNYGDPYETDDDMATAQQLGTPSGSIMLQDRCLDFGADIDYYEFQVVGNSALDVTLQPVGNYYILDGAPIWTNQIMDLGFDILDSSETVILSQNDNGIGGMEIVTDLELSMGTYYMRVVRYSGNDVQRYRISFNLELTDLTAVDDSAVAFGGLGLKAYPNPFNPKTTVRFHAPDAGSVALEIFNVQGRKVRSLDTQADAAGWMSITWNGNDDSGQHLTSGLYFIRASVGDRSETARVVMLK
jgi:hypothetical protein